MASFGHHGERYQRELDFKRRSRLDELTALFAASDSRVKAALKRSDERMAYKRRAARQHLNGTWELENRHGDLVEHYTLDRPPTRGSSDQTRGDD